MPGAVTKTGQILCYNTGGGLIDCAGTGQDGAWQKGVAPNPRFTDNMNGTVTDNATGLIWLKNANCFAAQTWSTAILLSNTLGNGACSLSDGSSGGQWRLPNVKELYSLVDFSAYGPTLPAGHPFINVQSPGYTISWYWSSTSAVRNTAWAMAVDFWDGNVNGIVGKTAIYYVWPVRGGQ